MDGKLFLVTTVSQDSKVYLSKRKVMGLLVVVKWRRWTNQGSRYNSSGTVHASAARSKYVTHDVNQDGTRASCKLKLPWLVRPTVMREFR